jgi:hypothetical protein
VSDPREPPELHQKFTPEQEPHTLVVISSPAGSSSNIPAPIAMETVPMAMAPMDPAPVTMIPTSPAPMELAPTAPKTRHKND